jgi:hypothetical protein
VAHTPLVPPIPHFTWLLPVVRTFLRDQLDASFAQQVHEPHCFATADLPEGLSGHNGFDIVLADQRLRLIVTYSRRVDGCRALRCLLR